MINLSSGFFKPMFILTNIVFAPILTSTLILTFVDFRVEVLIVTLFLLALYLAIVFLEYSLSRKQKYYLETIDCKLIRINYPNLQGEINVDDILKMEYYKISSVKAWCLLYSYVSPQSVYITYVNNGKEVRKLIGYPNIEEIDRLCKDLNITLTII